MKYGDPVFGKPGRKFKPRNTRVYNRYGLKAIHAVHGHGLAQPGPYVKKNRFKDWEPSKHKRLLLGIIILAFILSGTGFYADPTNPAFHSYGNSPRGDPATFIWSETFANSDISDFNCNGGTYVNHGVKGIQLDQSSATIPATCISKSSIDISSAAAKELEFNFAINATTQNKIFKMFLTQNSTLVSGSIGYDPSNDRNVALILLFEWIGGTNCGATTCTWFTRIDMQRASTQPLGIGQNQDCVNGFGNGVCFFEATSTSTGIVTPSVLLVLNYTGGTGVGNRGLSALVLGNSRTTLDTLPWLSLTGDYYIGFWAASTNGAGIHSEFLETGSVANCPGVTFCMDVDSSLPVAATAPPPANLDTGGFFGPIINALIRVGVFMLQNIISFATFLYTLYIAALNLLGSWLGLPNIGTNLDSFLRAFVQFMAQMATIIANLGSGITVLINDISFGATFIVGLLTSTASWLSAAVLLGGKLKQIFDLIFIYGNNMLWIFFWSTFFLYTATGEGWSGTLEFFNAVNWASSLGANFVIRMVNFGVQAIAFLKGFIPTEAGAPPPTSPVSEGGKPSGASLQSTAKPVPAQPSRFKAGFSRSNIQRARGTTATKFKLSASRPAAPSFSAALEWDPIKVILILAGLLLLMIWIGGGLSPFGTASASCTVNGTPVSISVTASPFTYTNNDPWREGVTILGGNVSKVEVLGGGTTAVIFQHIVLQNDWTGAGASLEVGWSVRVTYYSAPTMTHSVQATAGNTAKCFQSSYDVLSQITAPILLMFASIGSITFLADKFGMIGSTFSGPATFRAVPRRHARQRRELMKLRAREKQLRMEFRK